MCSPVGVNRGIYLILPMHFILYSRSYCHLCEDMLQALRAFDNDKQFLIDVIDIDADPELVARYDELVPVLMLRKSDGQYEQLCHYFLDETKLGIVLQSQRG